ncbi:LINE-1 retrotransposable element ORF1 protein [Anabarilius grahami]|uniref:LINE-1 retrotransposable element ORF1 protein n=1 Tax=Anabarilius grahami TaxID=495550 RepID=A0A3N0XLK7_ANAGA|nr:LINE-1 retrotransposable element ORF1 protein [Anabarilius grahami]
MPVITSGALAEHEYVMEVDHVDHKEKRKESSSLQNTPTKVQAKKQKGNENPEISNAALLETIVTRFDLQDGKLSSIEHKITENSLMIVNLTKAVEFNAAEIKDCKTKINLFEKQLTSVVTSHADLISRTSELERYKRRWNLRVIGMKETAGEDIRREIVSLLAEIAPHLQHKLEDIVDTVMLLHILQEWQYFSTTCQAKLLKFWFSDDEEMKIAVKLLLNLSVAAVENDTVTGTRFSTLLSSVCSYKTFPFDQEYCDDQSDFLLDLCSHVKNYETQTGRSFLPALQLVFQSPDVWIIDLSQRKTFILLEVLKLQTEKKPVELIGCSEEESEMKSFLQCLPYISQLRIDYWNRGQAEQFLLSLFIKAAETETQTGEQMLKLLTSVCAYRSFPYQWTDSIKQSDFLLDLYSHVKNYETQTGRSFLPALQSVFQSPDVWIIDLSQRKTSVLLEVLKLQTEKKPVDLRGCSEEESEVKSFLQCLPYISQLSFYLQLISLLNLFKVVDLLICWFVVNMPKAKAVQTDSNVETVTMASLTHLLESLRTAISEDFKQTFSALETKLNGVITTVTEHAEKLETLESEGDARELCLKAAKESITKLQTDHAKLAAKIADLESRSRRNNIRVIGVPESVEGPQPTAFCAKILEEVFGGVLDSPVECERAHRALASIPPSNQRPRPIILRLLRFQVKDKTIRHARTMRGRLLFWGHPILVFEDYPPDVVEQRKEFKTDMSELYERGFKSVLLYPARLYIKMESEARNTFPR